MGERFSLYGCGDMADGRAADLDDDGLPEFIALGSHDNCDAGNPPASGWNRVSLFTPMMGAVELFEAGSFPANLGASQLEIGDFNGDGDVDVVVADERHLMFHLGAESITFAPPLPVLDVAFLINGDAPIAADFDGDGTDETLIMQESGSFGVLMGTSTPSVIDLPPSLRVVLLVEDLDGDGRDDIVTRNQDANKYPLVVLLSGGQ